MELCGSYARCDEIGDNKGDSINRANKAVNLLKQRLREQSNNEVSLTAYADKNLVTNESIMRAVEPTMALKVIDPGSDITVGTMMKKYSLDAEVLQESGFYGLPQALLQNAEMLLSLTPSDSAGLQYEVSIGKFRQRESRQDSAAETSRFYIGCSVATRNNAMKPWVPTRLEAIFIYIPKPGATNDGTANLMDDCFNNTLTVFGLCFSGVQGGYHMAVLHGPPELTTPNETGHFGSANSTGATNLYVGKQCYIDTRAVQPNEAVSKKILGEIFKAVQHDLVQNKHEELSEEKFGDEGFIRSYRTPILLATAPIWAQKDNKIMQIPFCPMDAIVPLIPVTVLAYLFQYHPSPRAEIYNLEEMKTINAVLSQHPSFWSSPPLQRTTAPPPIAGSALPSSASAGPGTGSNVELADSTKEAVEVLNKLYFGGPDDKTSMQKKMAVEINRARQEEGKVDMKRPMKLLDLLLVLAKEELPCEQYVPWLTLSKQVGKTFNNAEPLKWDELLQCPQSVPEYLNGPGIPGLVDYIFMVVGSEKGECAKFALEDGIAITKWFVESAVKKNTTAEVVDVTRPVPVPKVTRGFSNVALVVSDGGGGVGGAEKRKVTFKEGKEKKKQKVAHEDNVLFWRDETVVEDFTFMNLAWSYENLKKKAERIERIKEDDNYDAAIDDPKIAEVEAEVIPPYDAATFDKNKTKNGYSSPDLNIFHEANMELIEKFKAVAAVVQSGDAEMQGIQADVEKLQKATAALEKELQEIKRKKAAAGAPPVLKSAMDEAVKKFDEKLKKHEEMTTAKINAKGQNSSSAGETVVTEGPERSIGSVRMWTTALHHILQLANDRYNDDSAGGMTTQYKMIKRFLTTTLKSMNVQLSEKEMKDIMTLEPTEEEL